MQRVVRERSHARVAGDLPREAVGGEAGEAHRPSLDRAIERPMRVFGPTVPAMICWMSIFRPSLKKCWASYWPWVYPLPGRNTTV